MNTERIEKLEHRVRVLVQWQALSLNAPIPDFQPLKPDPEFERLLNEFREIENQVNEETAPTVSS